jgi:hypothetical protein
VSSVNVGGYTSYSHCYLSYIGVRPLGIFESGPSDCVFWCKEETLIGKKIRYGAYDWTVLKTEKGEMYALCDGIIAKRRFDPETAEWENSEIKQWLENDAVEQLHIPMTRTWAEAKRMRNTQKEG